jgi:1-pyrroline-5-carboxylate dehydrogenase
MADAIYRYPEPTNEPVRSHAPGTPERASLVRALERCASEVVDIPVVIGGEHVRGERRSAVVMPHAHRHVLAQVHHASRAHVERAIDRALAVAPAWRAMPFAERASIFLKAADLLAGPHRDRTNAACMLGQSKTVHQSEIDAVCELADFLRFNVHFASRILQEQPLSPPGAWNRSEYRGLEGFVLAVTPFNFSSIGVNLAAAPALMGNVVLWKPATAAALAAWRGMELLREAGLPDGVINLVPGDGPEQGEAALASKHLAGVHFTGSTRTFRALWKGVAANLDHYRTFPRVVGETGGKDFLVAHPSADVTALVTAILRGGYEYQGQKCSALSRLYVPRSIWPQVRDWVAAGIGTMKVGDVRDFSCFMGAVIDKPAFDRIRGYLEIAKATGNVIAGGGCDDREGWFVQPTFVEVKDPKHRLMQEEIFGPVVTAYVYDDAEWSDTLDLVDQTSPYGLTGAVFARDRAAIVEAHARLANAAGNFYVNDKPTGAVVGQQPFGGARASGTNDKAGAMWNLLRWTSPRTVKETFVPPLDYRYPFMD